ncbi:MAG: ribosome recycling factor [Candidatus Hydrogenedentes bacterium]|nr:ribosome recycling factor [Candidatus Hydrogenedentota bacterium]
MPHAIVRDATAKMGKSVEAYQHELGSIRTSRAQAGLLDVVEVDAYGAKMKINQMGNISVPDPHLIVIDLWDKSQLPIVEKAILQSPLGITPSNDGRVIRVPFPPLTEERRKDLVKVAGRHREEAKVAVRNIRRHAIEQVKKEQKAGTIPEDDAHHLTEKMDKATEEFIEKIDEIFKLKEDDIMEV